MANKKKVYFTCALSGLTQDERDEMAAIRDTLREDFEILEYCDPKNLKPTEIFSYDIDVNVAGADLLVSIVDRGATGLGYEMCAAIEIYRKPVLALAHHDAQISPFVLGINRPGYEFRRYIFTSDVRKHARDFAQKMFGQ
jgi:hypothetical protein